MDNMRENWWVFGRPRGALREALKGLPSEGSDRFIVTPETSRRRYFTFLDGGTVPDNKLVVVASNDAYVLGVLSSRIHVAWMLAVGGRHGIGADPVYVKSQCFDAFPFPDAIKIQRDRIADIAEKIDIHRKDRQAKYPKLTLSKMYAVLYLADHDVAIYQPKELKTKEDRDMAANKKVYDDADIPTLKKLHDALEEAVAEAYGWSVDMSTEDLLSNLLELNQKRAIEEESGLIKWLRPDFQQQHSSTDAGQRSLFT